MKNLFHKSTILLFSLTLITSCGSDDNGTQVDVNTPPEGFNLLSVANGSTGVDRLPVFTWQASTDADGDEITYEVYMDTEDGSTLVESNITSSSYQPEQRLELTKEYQWRVIANDGKGGTTSSGTFSFTTRNMLAGENLTTNASFGEVWYQTTEYFNGNFLVLGGGLGNSLARNEVVWQSTDGVNWTDVTNSTSFTPRLLHASVVFKDKLWVIGGWVDGVIFRKDIWSSTDGVNWVQETTDGGLPELYNHEVVAYDDKLWIIGGNTTDPAVFDINTNVWVSEDGVNWSIANTTMMSFEVEYWHNLVAFDNKLWVIGGRINGSNFNEMWWTKDGNTWTKSEPQPGISFGSNQSVFVLDDRMWMLTFEADYYTTDGISWSINSVPLQEGFPSAVSTDFAIHNGAVWFPTFNTSTNTNGRVWIKE
ncbi:hypothetical protein [Flagellimonas eckloniae]|uniref:Fibronectin type-III domain-containing protein n=1 Tax=Flagellimonas eckloniae TaxID=346185 RepID=A0A0Q0WWR7_9FLAO|nr:hypothetical protein [Allomuricauda eckloniae]KQC29905.1 hypothetical protein AAY42_08420 [Allomuricauda eckloniae]